MTIMKYAVRKEEIGKPDVYLSAHKELKDCEAELTRLNNIASASSGVLKPHYSLVWVSDEFARNKGLA